MRQAVTEIRPRNAKSGIERFRPIANRTRRALTDELGWKKDAWQWDEMLRADGTIKIRAVFLDAANNAKATAWVEKEKVEKWSEGGQVDTREDNEDVDDDTCDTDLTDDMED